MAKILFTAQEIANRHLDVAKNYKTIYMYACYGWQVTSTTINVKAAQNLNGWYTQAHINGLRKVANQKPPTWGFDCVNLTKAILWGWTGDASKEKGGAVYGSNGVPDTNANGMIQKCQNVSGDFSNIEVGEGLWMEGHWGLYVGNGLAVECTGRWDNCVQITSVWNIQKKSGYNGRLWTKHGKLPWVQYSGSSDKIEVEKIKLGTRTIRRGTNGSDVKELQEALIKLGYDIGKAGADGDCGKKTEAAIKVFQYDWGLEQDGAFGSKSYAALLAALVEQPKDKQKQFLIADISAYQGNINWELARKELIMCIFRASIGLKEDTKYLKNATECGVPYGAYHYVKAGTAEDARKEAEYFVQCANKAAPLFYIADIEENAQNEKTTEPVCVAFLETLQKLGCKKIGLYINNHYKWAGKAIKMSDIIWIPHWGKNDGKIPEEKYAPEYPCDIWQYTSVGRVSGINGDVDLNILRDGHSLDWFTTTAAPADPMDSFYTITIKHVPEKEMSVLRGQWPECEVTKE